MWILGLCNYLEQTCFVFPQIVPVKDSSSISFVDGTDCKEIVLLRANYMLLTSSLVHDADLDACVWEESVSFWTRGRVEKKK